ncbi:RNA methyltransferase [Flavobacterium haoranii]|uniref:RNA methyltransferase, TrmH family n=1 Tax=Flavobacterium haoranii TaxID=683124 RepID=A0A1M6DI17_9FLAO|nr:RNA methyltransferase [Flavobacterium haoranii]SHI72658.1 RNA methyltransferase, TrmH family [Flavobacterium haoranii]
MLSKNQIKIITSLSQKKYRKQHQLFIAEGKKVIEELLPNFDLEWLFCVGDLNFKNVDKNKVYQVTDTEIKKISVLTTATNCLAVFRIPEERENKELKGLIVALDDIRDPGNLGTIIRLCDWFGIETLLCSEETVDVYNPKVVQATMGSISRVNVVYGNIVEILKTTSLPVFGTFMDGENIYKKELPKEGIIVMGNEANGISVEIEKIAKNKISIPRFGKLQATESLNVATATAIILSEFRRN